MKILRLLLCCALLLFVASGFAQQKASKAKASKTATVKEAEEDAYIAPVEEEPQFMGAGKEEFAGWVNKHIKYPIIAQEQGIQGKVYASFTVGADGQVKDIKILRGVDLSLDREAIRVIKASPLWIPAKQNGLAVPYHMLVAVYFRLEH